MINLNDDEHSIACHGAIVYLQPLEYAFIKWMLYKQANNESVTRRTLEGEKERGLFLAIYSQVFSDGMRKKIERSQRIATIPWFDERKSRSKEALEIIGLTIKSSGSRPNTCFVVCEME